MLGKFAYTDIAIDFDLDLVSYKFSRSLNLSLCHGVLKIVERADEDKDHLLVQGGDVVPDKEDDGAELTGKSNCVLGVQSLVFIGLAWGHYVPVDVPWLDLGGQLDEESTIGELRIVERGDWLRLLADPVE